MFSFQWKVSAHPSRRRKERASSGRTVRGSEPFALRRRIFNLPAGAKGERLREKKCEAFTLYSFTEPLAPVTAAHKAGCKLSLGNILRKIRSLPETNWRILETAGGLAVPLDETGLDAVDLALNLPVDYLLLVVQNRLGAIHQARVLTAYAPYSKITTGIWFNDRMPVDDDVTYSNYSELANLSIPIWGHQLYQSQVLRFFDSFPIAKQHI